MTHQAVLRFLNHWYSRQGDKKIWLLKFLKLKCNAVAAVEPESAREGGGTPQSAGGNLRKKISMTEGVTVRHMKMVKSR